MSTDNEKVELKPPPRAPKTLLQTLQELNYGHFATEGTAMLRETIIATERTGKVTEMTIKIKMKPGKGGRVEVFADLSNKLPKPERDSTILFISPEFNLVQNDPRQMEITGLRVVDKPADAGEPRGVRIEETSTAGAVRAV